MICITIVQKCTVLDIFDNKKLQHDFDFKNLSEFYDGSEEIQYRLKLKSVVIEQMISYSIF